MGDKEKVTAAELAEKSGADDTGTWVAVDGKVYDLSESGSWEGGDHYGEHDAGADLTEELKDAPHGMEVFDSFPVVGELE